MDRLPSHVKRDRRVTFANKCQVIPWTETDDDLGAEDVFRERAEAKNQRRRSRLRIFRSLSSSSSTSRRNSSSDDVKSKTSSSQSLTAHGNDANETRSIRALSPSLPINKNPAPPSLEKLRRKLVSPPPPSALQSPSPSSPFESRLAQASSSSSSRYSQSFASSHRQAHEGPATGSLTKPIAVRKPLSLGAEDDIEDTQPIPESRSDSDRLNEGGSATLRIPAVVAVLRSPILENGSANKLLNWREEEEEEEEDDDNDDDEEEEDAGDYEREEEELMEDLNEECVCPECEQVMTAALSQSYTHPWTRAARKKYLADRKQAQMEEAKRTSKLPSWLRSDGDEEEEVQNAKTARSIKADEVDSKLGTTKLAIVPIQTETEDSRVQTDATDALLKDEVDQEIRLRKEEERSKQSRSEMRRLSHDSSSGLRTGGGGARAMMRQLEEAERIEKRASIQRSNGRSPATIVEAKKEESRPMGAVKDTFVQPFTSPRRISDQSLPTMAMARTPSPHQQQKGKVVSPSKEEVVKDKDREHRHPSPSLLIRRELTLGIPVHSNTSGSRSSWPAHPPTRTPSPRLISPTTLEDIAEVPLTNLTEVTSGNSTPRRANTIGHGSQSNYQRRNSAPATDSKVKRANTLTSRPSRLSNEIGNENGLGLNLSQHAAQEGRFGQARHRARSSLKDLVARIKN